MEVREAEEEEEEEEHSCTQGQEEHGDVWRSSVREAKFQSEEGEEGW